MARRGITALTQSAASKLSPRELDEHIVWARAGLSMAGSGSLRKETAKQLDMLEAIRMGREKSSEEPAAASIIPTFQRAPGWKSTGYPIGAATISQALIDVPQYEHLRLRFSELDTWSEGAGQPLRVLEVAFLARPGGIFGPRFRRRAWDITVRAVLRALKKSVTTALTDTGLPRLRQ
jgi:hypothetical protein